MRILHKMRGICILRHEFTILNSPPTQATIIGRIFKLTHLLPGHMKEKLSLCSFITLTSYFKVVTNPICLLFFTGVCEVFQSWPKYGDRKL